MNTPNSLDKLNCEGGCEKHFGTIRRVNVSHKGYDWGEFYYCEIAIQEDISRGFEVKIINA